MAINWDAPIEIRDFRNGDWFWIQKSVWQDKKLSASDKIIYGTIAFFANQKSQTAWPALTTIASFSGVSERQTYRSLKQLEKFHYIKILRGGGRGKSNQYQLLKIKGDMVAEISNTTPYLAENSAKKTVTNSSANNNIYNKNKLTITNTKVLGAKPQFGNPDINICLEELTKLLGNKPAKETLNRYAIKRLITKLGNVERVISAINYAFKVREEDRYAPRIYNFMDLEEKLEHLKGYGKQKTTSKAVNVEAGIAYLEGRKSSVNVD